MGIGQVEGFVARSEGRGMDKGKHFNLEMQRMQSGKEKVLNLGEWLEPSAIVSTGRASEQNLRNFHFL